MKGRNIVVVAHQNTLRAIVKNLNNYSDKGKQSIISEVSDLEVPTAIPLVYEFDEKFNTINHYYLGEKEKVEARIEKSKMQVMRAWDSPTLSLQYDLFSNFYENFKLSYF